MLIDWGSQCSLLSKLIVRRNAIPIKMTAGGVFVETGMPVTNLYGNLKARK